MGEIIPRWEWRTFATGVDGPEEVFGPSAPDDAHESDETYLLTPGGSNVKVRDGLIDVKVLEEVAGGLERWMPTMKAPFPLPADQVTEVFEALAVRGPQLTRDAYSLPEFLDLVVGSLPGVLSVEVHKKRFRHVVNDCMAEFTALTIDGRVAQTVAVESPDPDAVTRTVVQLGLGDHLNVNYIEGLRRITGGTPERFAVIDVGTNSVKFHLAEPTDEGWTTVVDRAEITRLGERLEEAGVIVHDAAERTVEAIAGMVREAISRGAVAVAAVGTAGLRIAGNSNEIIELIRSRTGVTVEVVSGAEESRLAYLAVQAGLGLGDGTLVVFDTGGGSSQFTFGRGAQVAERFSVDVGAVRYTERFGLDDAVAHDVLEEAKAAIATDLSALDDRDPPDALVGMGGAVTNIAGVSHSLATYEPDVVQGTVLERTEIDRQIDIYRSRSAADRRSIVGLQPKRADVILAGACIVRTVMDKLGQPALTVSDRGLRHGLLVERFG